MILALGAAGMDFEQAPQKYAEMFTSDNHPSSRTIRRVYKRLAATGQFSSGKRKRAHPATSADCGTFSRVLAGVASDPHISVRHVAQKAGTSATSAWRILHEQSYKAYHVSLHQCLTPPDFSKRLDFCNYFLNMDSEFPNFSDKVLWSDEAHFARNAQVNTHNCHMWSTSNPHWVRSARNQYQWSFNVWAGLFNGMVIGPLFYDESLTGERYVRNVLEGVVLPFIEELPLETRISMFFQQDGAPPHAFHKARHFLDRHFPGKWIGRMGPVQWPARSPDLTPLDYYFWGRVKDIVYKSEPQTPADLQRRIKAACASLTREEILRATRDVTRRCQMCIGVDGDLFEHVT